MAAKTTLPVKDIRHRLRLEEQARDELRDALLLTVRAQIRAVKDYDSDPALALKAANDIQDRIWGRARQQTEVKHSVVSPAQSILDALTGLIAAKTGTESAYNMLNSLDDLSSRDKLSISHAPTIEGELIPLPPDNPDKSTG